ncbi:MAG: cysteine--tRNA ligase [Candidatus Sericytochromatia bacterium]
MIQLTNSLTGHLEPFVPMEEKRVKMYVCGPTVYGLLHIGNGRTFMTWDVVRRYLEKRGYRVTYVQNFTDIDDKIIAKAAEEGISPEAVAEKYTRAYFEDMDALGVRRADVYPRAVETIPEMIAHIEGLVAAGKAYPVEGDVYYRVKTFPEYGKLSGRKTEDNESGARVEVDPRKEDPSDFALWKAAKPGEPAWESPWCLGRPGWHIECSAMVRKVLGDTIDIHTGGKDLKFPHHENEIAQSEGLTGRPFVKYWMHTGFLNMDSEKMSKSLGNIKTTRDVVAHYGQQAVRVFLLSTKYDQDLDFTDENVKSAWKGFQRLQKTLTAYEGKTGRAGAPEIQALVKEADLGFYAAMDADFNTARAIAHFNEIASKMRKLATDRPELEEGLGAVVAVLHELASDVLGLDLHHQEDAQATLGDEHAESLLAILTELGYQTAPGYEGTEDLLKDLIAMRADAKANKNWAVADTIRNRLTGIGIKLVDQKDGTTGWEPA